MNTAQLWKCIKQNEWLQRYCTGVYASNTIPKEFNTLPSCFIMNTDSSDLPGTHWVAVYLSLYGPHEFFDSYGRTQSVVAPIFRKPIVGHWLENPFELQGPLSTTCGQYCLYYLSERCAGRTLTEIVSDFSNAQDQIENDEWINDHVNSAYNTELDVYDEKCIIMQTARARQK